MSRTQSNHVHDSFNHWAREYEDLISAKQWTAPDYVFEKLGPYAGKGTRILEVGIGTGYLSLKFKKQGAHIVGTDISPHMLAVCREKSRADVLHNLDLNHGPLPFSAGAFDMVIACGVSEFVPNFARLTGMLQRVLAPEGWLAITYEVAKTSKAMNGRHSYWCVEPELPGNKFFKVYAYQPVYAARVVRRAGLRSVNHGRFISYMQSNTEPIEYGLLTGQKPPASKPQF